MAHERAKAPGKHPPGKRASVPLTLALCGGYFLVLLDVTVVNVALPSIGDGLDASSAGLAWVVDGYTVPLAALLLVSGALGDRFGHRPIVLAGFAGFGAASAVCALAPGVELLVAGRALQGACAALMLPGTLALLTGSVADDRARTRAVGLWAAVGGAALPAGPLVGGLLAGAVGWRAVFWLNVPLIALAVVPVVRLPRTGRHGGGTGHTDRAGAAALVVLLAAAVTAVVEAPANPALGVAAGGVAAGSAVVLVLAERHASAKLLTVPRPSRPALGAACAVAGLMNLCVLGTLFLLTQLLQDVHGLSPVAAGLFLIPGMLPLPLLGAPAGRLAHRVGPWRASALGLAVAAAGFAGLAWRCRGIEGTAGHALFAVALAVWGAGLGLLTPAIVAAAMRAVPESPGTASGASNTARQTGGALGVAVFGALAGTAANAAEFVARTGMLLAGSAAAFAVTAGFCLRAASRNRHVRTLVPPTGS